MQHHTCHENLEPVLKEVLLLLGDLCARVAHPDWVDEGHPVELDLGAAARTAEDPTTTATMVLKVRRCTWQ